MSLICALAMDIQLGNLIVPCTAKGDDNVIPHADPSMLADGSNNSLELAFPLRLNPKIKGVSFQRVRDHSLAFSHIWSYINLLKKGPLCSGQLQRFCVSCVYLLICTSQKSAHVTCYCFWSCFKNMKLTFSRMLRPCLALYPLNE